MKAIRTTFIILLMIASTLCINVRGQSADKFVLKKITSAYQDQYGNYHSTTFVYSSDSLPKNYKSPTLKDVEDLAANNVVALFSNGQIDSVTTKHLRKRSEYPSANKSIEIGIAGYLADQVTYPKISDTAITRVALSAKTDPALDTCKREYIALSRSYEDLKQDYADAVYINSMDKIYAKQAHEKQLKKAKRKKWFNGFLWGNVVGILALAFVMK